MKKVLFLFIILIIINSQNVFATNDWVKEIIGAKDSVGKSIKIAIIDTGISAISSDRIAKGKNYVIDDSTTADTIGHGTAIAKLILDISPQSTLVPLVFCAKDDDNKIIKADNEKLAKIIRDAIDIFECQIINISGGTTENNEELFKAICYAEEKGAVVISSVGNSNNENANNIYYPAAYDTVIGVGAICKDGSVATFSQRNNSVSLCAPGDELTVLKPNGKNTITYGTSYATAFVSAAVANVLSENSELAPNEVRKILYNTAMDIEDKGYDIASGYGRIQINSALDSISKNLYNKIILTIGNTKATVWGKEVVNDVIPIIKNERTMLPIRFIAETLGATVIWEENKQMVTIIKDNKTILVYIGSDKAYIDNNSIVIDSPAFIENNRTYLPLRFVAENLGATVNWDEGKQQIEITKKN